LQIYRVVPAASIKVGFHAGQVCQLMQLKQHQIQLFNHNFTAAYA
jgi:hypothetical protein